MVLKELGYPHMEAYQDRSLIQNTMEKIIKNRLEVEGLECESLSELKAEIKKQAFIERMKIAGVDPAHIKHMRILLNAMFRFQKSLTEHAHKHAQVSSLHTNSHASIGKKICENIKLRDMQKVNREERIAFLHTLRSIPDVFKMDVSFLREEN